MTNLSSMVEAVRQLNQTWKSCNNLENERIPNEVYYALCDIDEAINNLIEKVGDGARLITTNSIFGNI